MKCFTVLITIISLLITSCQFKYPNIKNETTVPQGTISSPETTAAPVTTAATETATPNVTDDIQPSLENAPYLYFKDGMYVIDNSYKDSPKYDSWFPIKYDSHAKIDLTAVHLKLTVEKINKMEEPLDIYFQHLTDPSYGKLPSMFGSMVGNNNENFTLENVCDCVKEFCSPLAIQKAMNDVYHYSINGRIYELAAAGKQPYLPLSEISFDDVVSIEGNMVKLKVIRTNVMKRNVLVSYTVLISDDDVYILDFNILSFDSESGTFYIPQPIPLDEATYLYHPLLS